MQGKISPVFRLFEQQFEEAKAAHAALSKQFKGKKAIELESRLIFLEIYIDLLAHIHFEKTGLKFKLFSPFKDLFRGLKKTKHLKMVTNKVEEVKLQDTIDFKSYTKSLLSEKNSLYAEVYDHVVRAPLLIWDELFEAAYKYSKGLKPLMINTATTQIINEELEYFNLDHQNKLDSKALKDIYEGLRVIIALENLRIESGFNPVFIAEVHEKMSHLQKSLLNWYENHLFLQHLTGFLAEKQQVSKKYLDLLQTLRENKKWHKTHVEKEVRDLFDKILA
ncbi:hypothetical protein [Arthrospiribacter ruber]|uniref:Uncharacterized protein n=1 Tax=Arthrospiribacter ruber TaxID=2487934 RepID=A0A951IQ81_9BACT|nr:hypothetical protein [Arthrospiribacter ruber]MBW3466243.1 hypothetical protein [Arthrospiribacter ruber]